MKRLLAAVLAALIAPGPAAAGLFRAPEGRAAVRLPLGLFAAPSAGWGETPLGSAPVPKALEGADLSPLLHALDLLGVAPAAFQVAGPERQNLWLAEAEALSRLGVSAQAEALIGAVKEGAVDPLAFTALYMLDGPYAAYLSETDRARAGAAYRSAYKRLALDDERRFHEALERTARSLRGFEEPMTALEAMAASLPLIPSAAMTPRVERLRGYDKDREIRMRPPVPAYHRGIILRGRVLVLKTWYGGKAVVARRLFKPARELWRWWQVHKGQIYRKYVSGQEMDRHTFRWTVVEELHRKGDFRGALGHPVHDGTAEAQSGAVFRADLKKELMAQKARVGRDLYLGAGETVSVKPFEVSAMMGVSGMSFPQLSAASHLSLLYIHLKLAKEHGVRFLINTGEGGPALHLAFLHGDRKALERFIVEWNIEHGQFKRGSWRHAKVAQMVDSLMRQRAELFKEFSPQDLARAQVTAQFGSALNGVRGPGSRVDYDRLKTIGRDPYVAMVQFKLKQAAKRGGKVDVRKVDDIVSAFRDIERGKPYKSPELNPEMDSYEHIAALVLAAKIVSKKPVSLKLPIGDAEDAYDLLEFLRDAGALPDHLQVEGRGEGFSPGSGNAPPMANSSLPVKEAVLVADVILKKLGVRDQIFVEATGDALLPIDAVERLMMGADALSAARGWMAMGLGCAMVKACDNGNCPYGIASRNDTLVGLSLDAREIAPKGYAAALNWFSAFSQTMAEAGIADWRAARRTHTISSARLRVQNGPRVVTLDWVFNADYIENLLRGLIGRGTLTRDEAVGLVNGS